MIPNETINTVIIPKIDKSRNYEWQYANSKNLICGSIDYWKNLIRERFTIFVCKPLIFWLGLTRKYHLQVAESLSKFSFNTPSLSSMKLIS